MRKGVTTPAIDFTDVIAGDIEVGSFLFGFDINNSNKLTKMNSALTMTVIEGAGGGGISSIPVSKVLYVDQNYGDDITGTYEDFTKPFQTIAAAQAVANTGDTIVIEAGVYTDATLGKDGIDYYYKPGTSHIAAYCFSDGGLDIEFNVYGYCDFFPTNAAVAVSAGRVTFNCKSISTDFGVGLYLIAGGRLIANIIEDITTGSNPCIRMSAISGNPSGFVKARNMISNRVCLFGDADTDGSFENGEMTIFANKILLLDPTPYVCVGISAGKWNIHAEVESTATGFGLYVGMIDNSGGELNVYGDINGRSAYTISNRGSNLSVSNFYGKITSVGLIITAGGVNNFRNKVVNNFPTREAISHTNGKTIVYDLVCNLDSSGTGHGIVVAASGLILKQTASIFISAEADSINAAAAQTIKTYPGAVANANINVNITETVSTLNIGSIDSEQ